MAQHQEEDEGDWIWILQRRRGGVEEGGKRGG
jgi:hypothetical protein